MVVADNALHARDGAQRLQNLRPQHGVLLHDFKLVRVERAGFVQDALGDADLAHVVQDGGQADFLNLFIGQAEVVGHQGAVARDVLGVPLGVVILGVDGERQRSHRFYHGRGQLLRLVLPAQ